jgi:hypothetical protein
MLGSSAKCFVATLVFLTVAGTAHALPPITSGVALEAPVGKSTGVPGDAISRVFGAALRVDVAPLFRLTPHIGLAPGAFVSLGLPGSSLAAACGVAETLLCAMLGSGFFVDAEVRAGPKAGPWARAGFGASLAWAGSVSLERQGPRLLTFAPDPLRLAVGWDRAGRRVSVGPFASASFSTIVAAATDDPTGRTDVGVTWIRERALHARLALGLRLVIP